MESAKHDVQRKTLEERNQMSDLERLRHSCAHVLATAVLRLWPDARLDIGPPTAEGFYYDFDLEHRFSPEDFETIEAEMKKVTKENQTFERSTKTREEAKAYYAERGQNFKVSPGAEIGSFASEVTGWEGVEIIYEVSGEADLVALVHVDDTVALRTLLDKMWMAADNEIASTTTELVLEQY